MQNYNYIGPTRTREPRYCSEVTDGKCICTVGGDYPRVPKFNLVCTKSDEKGCVGSKDRAIIPSTNDLSNPYKRKADAAPLVAAKKRKNISAEDKIATPTDVCTPQVQDGERLVQKLAVTLLTGANFSREEKMSEIWKIPSPMLPCKDFITTILAATPEGGTPIQVTGSELSPGKKWTQEKNAGTLTKAVFNQSQRTGSADNPMADAKNYDATLIILGEHLTFGNQGFSPDHTGFDCPSNDCGPIIPWTVGAGQSEGAVNLDGRIYEVQAASGDFGKKGDTVKIWSTLRSPGAGYDKDPIITFTWKKDTATLSGETPTVTVTQTRLPGGPGKVQIGKVSGQYNSGNRPWSVPFIPGSPDSAAALILVPGLKVQNHDSLTLYRDNLPFYAMPSWIEENTALLSKSGFNKDSWMQVVILDLSYKYLNARQFQSLFTDPDEYGAVLQFYMGVDDDDYKMENVVVPVDVEALEKEEEEQEKMDLPYLKKDDKGIEYMEIPWDTVRQIKDEPNCGKEECVDPDYPDGRPKDESCALCTYFLTSFLATLFWTAKQKGDHAGGMRRKLKIDNRFVVPEGNYMYVTSIYTERTRRYIRYGTHTSNGKTYSTPSPAYWRVKIPGGGCWANFIFKLVMYLSKHECTPIRTSTYVGCLGWKKMEDNKNNISTFALLNHNIPSNRNDASYELNPSYQREACPPNHSQREAWLKLQGGINTARILRYFDFGNRVPVITNRGQDFKPTFPNDECWMTRYMDTPLLGRNPLTWLNMSAFFRGGVGLTYTSSPTVQDPLRAVIDKKGSTNLWDYTQGGRSGVDENDPEANPPLIWDKCCANSCYKPCSEDEKADGCVTGNMPGDFYPRFKFTNVDIGLSEAQPTHMPEVIPPFIQRLLKTGVIGASIRGDKYFMQQLETIDFSGLWNIEPSPPLTGRGSRGEQMNEMIKANLRDVKYNFNNPLSADQLKSMLNPVVDAMECQSYVFRAQGVVPAVGDQFYVSSYPPPSPTPVTGVEQIKIATWGPFRVIKITHKQALAEGEIVLNSNDLFGVNGKQISKKNRNYFLHKNIDDGDKNIQLISKIPHEAHSVTIVGYKSSGSTPIPVVKTRDHFGPDAKRYKGVFPLPARFSDEDKSKVNYFIVDINWRAEKNHSYVLIPMPSVFELTQPDAQSAGVPLDSIKTVFNRVNRQAKKVTPYSVSAFISLYAADLVIINGPNAANDAQDLRPSGGTGSSSSEPVWPLILAVALCVAVIVIWKRVR